MKKFTIPFAGLLIPLALILGAPSNFENGNNANRPLSENVLWGRLQGWLNFSFIRIWVPSCFEISGLDSLFESIKQKSFWGNKPIHFK